MDLTRTAEHVSGGHPDKACDQMADAILDKMLILSRSGSASQLAPNPALHQRAAIEILAKNNLVVVSGEVRMSNNVATKISIEDIIKDMWEKIGYENVDDLEVLNQIQTQSPELQVNADRAAAGDQGIMVGFATNCTDSYLPFEYEAARNLCSKIEQLRIEAITPWLGPDAKTQVSIDENNQISRVIIAVQHSQFVDGTCDPVKIQKRIKAVLMEHAVIPILGKNVHPESVTVNGSGSFVVGGTFGDAGVVGRKIVVDAYGPHVQVGGGAFSGKDPTKVDRSGAYMARHIAKTAAYMGVCGAKEVLVHLAYGIGQHQPEMITAKTETGSDITSWVRSRFPDLSPANIGDTLGLWEVSNESDWRYTDTAAFGHFGRPEFPWEQIANVSD